MSGAKQAVRTGGALAWRVSWPFAVLLLMLEIALFGYWNYWLLPRLKSEATNQAAVLAQSQSALLADALTADPERISARVQAASDQLLLLSGTSDRPVFSGLTLELDYDALGIDQQALANFTETPARKGQKVEVALNHPSSGELIGIATLWVDMVFFNRLANDIRRQMWLQLSVLAMTLLLLWMLLVFLISRHEEQRQRFADELTDARDQALAASRSKSQFLANMSHEIRTPMNAVLGMATLLKKSSLDARQQVMMAQLTDSAKVLLGVLNDILDLSRIEAGKLPMQQVEFRLRDCLQSLSTMLRERAHEKQLSLSIEKAEDVPDALIGDPLRLQQVLTNLTSNAIKFTELGSVRVKVETLALDGAHCRLKFSVHDTGIGFTEAARKRLFEAFSQVDESDARKHGGAGLGLAICRRLVELMEGRIDCESVPGKGSVFFFDARFRCAPERQLQRPSDALRALVVDDHPTTRDLLGSMLEAFQFAVVLSESGEQALIRMSQERFDLILLDWRLPGMSGIDAVREMDRRGLRRAAKPGIVLMSAFADAQMLEQATAVGVQACLNKPIDQQALFDAVMQVLKHDESGSPSALTAVRAVDAAKQSELLQGKVLVVEDHPINREVAIAILASLGVQAEAVEGGRQALERLKAAPTAFDLVLMDVQMPEMDGVTATALIKAELSLKHLPIIALTAHAMLGDRERFLAAGMDEYLTKPLDEVQLRSMLLRFLGTRSGLVDQQQADVAAHLLPETMRMRWQAAGMDIGDALKRLAGKHTLIDALLSEFAASYRDTSKQLEQMVGGGELSKAAAVCHAMRGASGSLALPQLAAACAELEQALRNGKDFPEARKRIRDALEQIDSAYQVRANPAELMTLPASLLSRLQSALSSNDLAAGSILLPYLSDLNEAARAGLMPLQQAIDALEYDRALAMLASASKAPQAETPHE
jgi:signal transduction histidine kinase/DNA-binding response OmpR family regulator